MKILSKFHPMRWQCAVGIQPNNKECRHNRYCAIWVALEEDNTLWYENNKDKDASFIKHLKETKSRSMTLPVAVKTKSVKKKLEGLGDMVFKSYYETVE